MNVAMTACHEAHMGTLCMNWLTFLFLTGHALAVTHKRGGTATLSMSEL